MQAAGNAVVDAADRALSSRFSSLFKPFETNL